MAEMVDVVNDSSEEVKELVDHVWREAMAEVTAVLGDIRKIKLEQVGIQSTFYVCHISHSYILLLIKIRERFLLHLVGLSASPALEVASMMS